jgi:hypothetical protein
MANELITRISLPTHHPAVTKCADGGEVTIRAKRVSETKSEASSMSDLGRPKGPQPPPVNTDFHVTHIEPSEPAAEEAGETAAQERAEQRGGKRKKASPMDYLKSKQK